MISTQNADVGALVTAARQGDQSAWRELFVRFMPLLRSAASRYRLSADETADVVQITWWRCLENAHQLKDNQRFAGWISVICRRECLLLVNRRRREVSLELLPEAVPFFGAPDPEDPCAEAVRQDEVSRLRQAIARLPHQQRRVVQELMRHDGESYGEVARRLGIPVGSVGPTRQRALQRLKIDLESMGTDLAPSMSAACG